MRKHTSWHPPHCQATRLPRRRCRCVDQNPLGLQDRHTFPPGTDTWARFIGGIDPDGWVMSDETSKHFHRKFAKMLSNFHKFSQLTFPQMSDNVDYSLRFHIQPNTLEPRSDLLLSLARVQQIPGTSRQELPLVNFTRLIRWVAANCTRVMLEEEARKVSRKVLSHEGLRSRFNTLRSRKCYFAT